MTRMLARCPWTKGLVLKCASYHPSSATLQWIGTLPVGDLQQNSFLPTHGISIWLLFSDVSRSCRSERWPMICCRKAR